LRLITCVIGVGLLGAAAQVSAQDPTLIYACVANANGNVRLVADGSGCKVAESLVTWAKAGTPGPAGPTGATGATGATGPQGPSALGPSGHANEAFTHSFTTCIDPGVELLTMPLTITDTSTILVFGQAVPQRSDSTSFSQDAVRADLMSGGVVIASRLGTRSSMTVGQFVGDNSTVSGPLLNPLGNAIFAVPPGTYNLRLFLLLQSGLCGQTVFTPGGSPLSFQAFVR
jgi:hypothetical protein